ncbi:MAG: galactokinase [Armatimonadetes bacterium]|nr:galactokinase [Armatimonadota bacterium]
MKVARAARKAYIEQFRDEPEVVAFAPGRINLIGEHTDYNDGYVFPVAIDRGIAVAASRSNGSVSEMTSLEVGKGAPFDTSYPINKEPKSWTVYPAGMAWAIHREFKRAMPNLCAVVHGDLPVASGVSSSAAIEVAFGRVYAAIEGFELDPFRLAQIAQRCEIEFVGVNCGIMDMTASSCAKAGCAMLLDTRSFEIRHVPLPKGLSIALLDTCTPRALSASAYNERRSQCEAAAAALGVPSLRDATESALEAKKNDLPATVFRRARHVITENQRCLDFVAALEGGDFSALGDLMAGSHASLRDDYEVSSPELNAMVEAALASPGCVGARMTGAGFGGACVALTRSKEAANFLDSTKVGYAQRTGRKGSFLLCSPSEGAHIVESIS